MTDIAIRVENLSKRFRIGLRLETVQHRSDYFLERLPADGQPYWDLDDPAIPDVPRDTSAAAIAAAG